MPGGDQTGPTGQGPQTGRGAGYCGGNEAPGFATAGRRGFGGGRRGRGQGRRRRNRGAGPGDAQSNATPPPSTLVPKPEVDEVASLKQQADDLAASLRETQIRIAELEKKAEEGGTPDSVEA